MFLEVVRSEGLAHLSYVLGDHGRAAVIDPRRDCQVYLDIARRRQAVIAHVIETHRNEDYVIGSMELTHQCGAEIFHGKAMNFKYGKATSEGDTFELGDILLRVLETPGHTDESISITLADTGCSEDPVAAFTGDTLFVGEVGRTDFFPDRAEEVAGLLYGSIFGKLLPLGDHVILYPAHGAGSVCGSAMAAREFSTLGYERLHNPRLQMTRKQFVHFKVNEHHYQPAYFRRMEAYNLSGDAPPPERVMPPAPLSPDELDDKMRKGMQVLDVRSPEAFAGAFVPGSLSIPLGTVPAFAGYLLSFDQEIALVVEDTDDVGTATTYLARIGYDRVVGFLAGGLSAWEKSGRPFDSVGSVSAEELKRRLKAGDQFTLLDVRSEDEVNRQRLPDARHVYVGLLPDRLEEIPRDRPVVTLCDAGRRAVIAASILRKNGFGRVATVPGSMQACQAVGCTLVGGHAEAEETRSRGQ